MFADPQNLTVGSATPVLPRTGSGIGKGVFKSADGAYTLNISHQTSGTRTRSLFQIESSKTSADPLVSGRNVPVKATVHVVVDRPAVGFSSAELKDLVLALTNALSASSGAKAVQLVGGES